MKILKKIDSHKLFSNPYWDYYIDTYCLPDDSVGKYHFVHSRGSTIIIPLLNEFHFIMIGQYRYLNQKLSIEFPGGGIKKGKTPSQNAKEELLEETGLIANKCI